MTSTVAGSFATGANTAGDGDMQSGVLVVHAQASGNMLITTTGDWDNNNKARLQKSLDNGASWSNISTINSIVTKQTQAVAAGEHWRFSCNNLQARKTIGYVLTLEN